NLGVCYNNGHGVAQSYEEAVKWYRKSADQGDSAAQFNLGCCYENGQGVPQCYDEAIKWYRKSAEQGYRRAKDSLTRLKVE
ncbi:tetratricopeptide repeat protein, partial [Segatella copri]